MYGGLIHFCHLCCPFDEETTAVGRDGRINGRVVAHDVLEHTLAHRLRNYVPWEEELHAIGAAAHIRYVDVQHDYEHMLEDVHRGLKPIPYTVLQHVADNPLDLPHPSENKYCEDVEVGLSVRDHINWGYLRTLWLESNKNCTVPDSGHFHDLENEINNYYMHEEAHIAYFTYDLRSKEFKNTRNIHYR